MTAVEYCPDCGNKMGLSTFGVKLREHVMTYKFKCTNCDKEITATRGDVNDW